MRGMELPINMIVIIAVAVLVLTVIAAFFTGALGGGQNAIATEQAFNKGCQLLRSVNGCTNLGFDVSGYSQSQPGKPLVENPNGRVSMLALCDLKGAGADQNACLRLCGCPGL